MLSTFCPDFSPRPLSRFHSLYKLDAQIGATAWLVFMRGTISTLLILSFSIALLNLAGKRLFQLERAGLFEDSFPFQKVLQ